MAMIEVDGDNFNEEIEAAFQRGDVMILKFISMYCDSCMALGFELEELDEKMENLTILEIDCGASEDLAQMYDIIEVPTMKIYKSEDRLIYEGVGVVLSDDIEEMIQETQGDKRC